MQKTVVNQPKAGENKRSVEGAETPSTPLTTAAVEARETMADSKEYTTPSKPHNPPKRSRLTGLWWWIDRWRKSTAYTGMTLEEQGAYRNLLDEAALRGGAIPNNEDTLARACGDARRWRKLRPVVLSRFTLGEDGWRHETMDEVIAESKRRAEKQRNFRNRHGNEPGNGASNNGGNK